MKIEQIDTHLYIAPKYKVGPEGLEFVEELIIPLVKGAKDNPIQTGVLTQDLISLCISYYKDVNVGEMSTRETSVAITKLEEALMWLSKRTQDRAERGVLNTYKS